MKNELWHHGILGQKWGVMNGPPYPLNGGQYSASEKKEIYKRHRGRNSSFNKKHFDQVIKKGTKIQTLSQDKDRTKKTPMFYATYKRLDNHQYNALFNQPIKVPKIDKNGNQIGYDSFLKYRITNVAKKNLNVASEDSSSKVFKDLYTKDRDFYNFVTDKTRMQSYFVDSKYIFRGYREARTALENIRSNPKSVTEKDVSNAYRMFNYVLPYTGDKRGRHDVEVQRAKFFKEMKNKGYSAVLDTNDAIYGGMKTTAPIIVFDMNAVSLKGAERTSYGSKQFSKLVTAGRKVLGI